MPYLMRWMILLLSFSFLAGCGGGGGGGTSSSGGGTAVAVSVTGISPAFAFPGDTVTVIGTSFSSVSGVRLGTLDVSFTLISETRLSFVVPDNAVSGTVTVLSGTASFPAPTTLTVYGAPQVSSVTPSSARPGDSLTLTGTNLVNVARVQVGGVLVIPTTRTGTQLVVAVPAGASDGSLALLMSNGATRSMTQTFTLQPAMITVTGMTPTSGPEGSVISVTGAALDTVTGVTVGGTTATILSQSASTLTLAAPKVSGAVVLTGPGGQSVTAGTFSLTTSTVPVVSIKQVDVAQSYSQPSGLSKTLSSSVTIKQILVPGKAALIRAYVVANQSIAAPAVTATINGCAAAPTLTLSGPSSLPTSTPASDNLAGTFSAQIPASCVTSGLMVTISVASTSPANSGASQIATPQVGSATSINVVLVPLVTNGSTGSIPDLTTVKRMFARAYPIDASRITLSVRTPFTLQRTVVSTGSDWSAALAELENLRKLEASGKNYVGLVPSPNFNGGTSGLAYQNTGSSGAFLSAILLDAVALNPSLFGANASLDTMTHEVGHNMSLGHAPCGTTNGLDPNFPYSGGGLGAYPVHEFDANRDGSNVEAVYFPGTATAPATADTSAKDVMGYCNGEWFSDYNYGLVQSFMQTLTSPMVTPYAAPLEMLDFSGEIRGGKVTLGAPGARMTTQPYVGGGDYTLRVTTTAATVVEVPFAAVTVADEVAGVMHFFVSLPNPGEIAKVEVLHGTQSLPVTLDAPPVASASVTGSTTAGTAPQVSWSESGGQLKLSWDAARYPVLGVSHVGAQTTVLALRLTGGSASLPTAGLPAGGQWAFSLSGGLNAKSVTVSR